MITGRKFQIHPSAAQAKLLRGWIGCQRYIYNAKVDDMRYQLRLRALYKAQYPDVETPFIDFSQDYSKHTKEVDFLKAIPSQILRNGAYRFMCAIKRWNKKLAKQPTRKKSYGKKSVLVTSELFSINGNVMHLGNQKYPVGYVTINAHNSFEKPKMICISVDGNRWFVSFCNDDGLTYPTHEELLDSYVPPEEDYLLTHSVGIDRGVKINACVSNGTTFVYSIEEQRALKAAQDKKKKYQKQMSRRFVAGPKPQSNKYYQAKASKQKAERKIRNIRANFNHKSSYALAHSETDIIFVEELKLNNMTKAPKPKLGENGEHLPNGAKAKAGLNKAILNNGLGQLIQFTRYKALKNQKLVLGVPAQYTSQKCSQCGHIEKGNRISQSDFTCLKCGFTDNADLNASKNIRNDGIKLLRSGHYHSNKKVQKKVRVGRCVPCRSEVQSGR